MLMPDVTWNGLSYSRPIFWWTKLALLRVALALRKVNFVNRNIQALNKPTLPCCELCIQFCFNASAWAPGTSQSLVNSSCALPPPPPGYCRAFAGPVRPEGEAFAKFALPGAGHLPTPRFWHARGFLSEYDYTEDFIGKASRLGSFVGTVDSLLTDTSVKRTLRVGPCLSLLLSFDSL